MASAVPRTESSRPPGDIKVVPAEPAERELIVAEAVRAAAELDRRQPPMREDLERLGARVLERAGIGAAHLGFAMVSVSNEFWREQFAAVPSERRLLLLPHCLRAADKCAGRYDSLGLHCAGCGACDLAAMKREAEDLGYRVLIAEGTPAVVEVVLSGRIDAVLGVACLDSLDEAYDRIAQLGVPNIAVPLLIDGCNDTEADDSRIADWMHLRSDPPAAQTRSYAPLLREARGIFEPDELRCVLETAGLPRRTDAASNAGPDIGELALDWLMAGGKRFRPFVTLAAYAAPALGPEALRADADLSTGIPHAVRLLAVAIETLHKASLVHDDIEDDDAFRYGRPTMHRRYGVPIAVNVGDYLVGLGYGCIAAADELGPAATADVLRHLADAHVKLCSGQGVELELAATGRPPTPAEVQTIYALKTAPAFEAAMYAGLRAAASTDDPPDVGHIRPFCRYVGVAYQVMNDLKDWERTGDDKVVVGSDVLAGRPTMLRAWAHAAGLRERDVEAPGERTEERLAALRRAYESAGIFSKAGAFAGALRKRALAEAGAVKTPGVGDLMRFVVETVL
jgi:geranylgeranyl pyrophosphate synthase